MSFKDYSLVVLRLQTLERLSALLNPKKRLLTADGKLRDWTGLAELAGLTAAEKQRVEAALKSDYTRCLISIWCSKDNATIEALLNALQLMDRWDVVQDVQPLLLSDCKAAQAVSKTPLQSVDRSRALTLQDLADGKSMVVYDAMVLFGDAEEDQAFGSHLIERLEEAGLKVFVPWRDLVAGTVEHETSSKIIAERCRKVVAVFSPSFLESERSMFLTGFAQHVGIMDGQNDKIIPIILRSCRLPVQYQMYHKVVYDPMRKHVNFWDKILRVTFALDVPESLKTYDFFLPTQEQPKLPEASAVPNYDEDDATVMTTMTELSIDQTIHLPDPPSEDPSLSTDKPKKHTKLKQLKNKLGFKKSKKAQGFSEF